MVALAGCYAAWFGVAIFGSELPSVVFVAALGVVTTFYWSLVHEIIHCHPTRNRTFNELLVALPLGWVYPVARFRETHLEHHDTGELTDPFDDPESWYLAEGDWGQTRSWMKQVLRFNNTLFGRLLIGPLITVPSFVSSEMAIVRGGGAKGRAVLVDWMRHAIACLVLAALLAAYSSAPLFAFVAAAYLGTSLLLIRTFLEHQASEAHGERTVIIEALCPIAFLFLFNNLHCVHHTKPGVAWFRLPQIYRANRDWFISSNNGYVYRSYLDVFRKYFFRAKEPVVHPHLRKLS